MNVSSSKSAETKKLDLPEPIQQWSSLVAYVSREHDILVLRDGDRFSSRWAWTKISGGAIVRLHDTGGRTGMQGPFTNRCSWSCSDVYGLFNKTTLRLVDRASRLDPSELDASDFADLAVIDREQAVQLLSGRPYDANLGPFKPVYSAILADRLPSMQLGTQVFVEATPRVDPETYARPTKIRFAHPDGSSAIYDVKDEDPEYKRIGANRATWTFSEGRLSIPTSYSFRTMRGERKAPTPEPPTLYFRDEKVEVRPTQPHQNSDSSSSDSSSDDEVTVVPHTPTSPDTDETWLRLSHKEAGDKG